MIENLYAVTIYSENEKNKGRLGEGYRLATYSDLPSREEIDLLLVDDFIFIDLRYRDEVIAKDLKSLEYLLMMENINIDNGGYVTEKEEDKK